MDNNENYDTIRRCITGAPTTVDRCVGFCKNKNHVGYITVPILCKKQCIKKGCFYFVPLKEHPYWEKRDKLLKEQFKKKEELKIKRNFEKLIPIFLKIPPENFLICKHLYENVYIIVCKQGLNLNHCYEYEGNIIFAFEVDANKARNIELTYDFLLPQEIREKKFKNDQKNRER